MIKYYLCIRYLTERTYSTDLHIFEDIIWPVETTLTVLDFIWLAEEKQEHYNIDAISLQCAESPAPTPAFISLCSGTVAVG